MFILGDCFAMLGEYMLDDKVKMRVIPQISGPKHARRGQPALRKNTLLWCIEYLVPNGGIFTYAYYRKQEAIKAMNTAKQYGADTERYRQFNAVPNVNKAMHVMPKEKIVK